MDQYIGKLLDNRYEILEQIGLGGMARVFRARDHRLNRLVAIKVLREDLAQDAEFRRRFHDESQAVAMLFLCVILCLPGDPQVPGRRIGFRQGAQTAQARTQARRARAFSETTSTGRV